MEEQKPDEEKSAETSKNDAATSGGGGGWFSWYEGAKAKTISTLGLVKRDLNEFSEVVGQQALATVDAVKTHAPSTISHAVNPGEWVKSLVGTVNTVLQIVDTTEGEEKDEVAIPVPDADNKKDTVGAESCSKNAKLFAIQTDPGTFLNEPSGAPDLFEDWLDRFNLVHKKPIVCDLLVHNIHISRMYRDLVPGKVSNRLFWERYFYKIHQYDLDKARIDSFLQRNNADQKRDDDDGKSRDRSEKQQNSLESWDDDSDLEQYELPRGDETEDEDEKTLKEKLSHVTSPLEPVDSDLDDHTCTAVLELEDKNRRKSSLTSTNQQQPLANKEKASHQVTSSNASEWSRTNSESSFLNDAVVKGTQSPDLLLVDVDAHLGGGPLPPKAPNTTPNDSRSNSKAPTQPTSAQCSSGAPSPVPPLSCSLDQDFVDVNSENSFCLVNSGASSDNGTNGADTHYAPNCTNSALKNEENGSDW